MSSAWAQDDSEAPADAPLAFVLDIQAPEPIANGLARHLELQRYKRLTDLDNAELERLLSAADVQARELLATWGFFAPALDWQTTAGPTQGPRWSIRLKVETGPQARISEVRWSFTGHIQNSKEHRAQRETLQHQWPLPVGQPFTQEAWTESKSVALRQLTAEHYPLARLVYSEALVLSLIHISEPTRH